MMSAQQVRQAPSLRYASRQLCARTWAPLTYARAGERGGVAGAQAVAAEQGREAKAPTRRCGRHRPHSVGAFGLRVHWAPNRAAAAESSDTSSGDATQDDEDAPPRKLPRTDKAVEVVDLTGMARHARDARMPSDSSADAQLCAAQDMEDEHRAAAHAALGLAAAPTAAYAPGSLADGAASLLAAVPSSHLALCNGSGSCARLAPDAKFQRIGKLKPCVSREDRAELRRVAKELEPEGPARWKMIAASPLGQRLGFTTKQLRDAVKQKPQEPPSSAPWSDELQQLLLEEVASRGRVWADSRRDGAGGAFSAFRSEDLRRHYDEDSSIQTAVCKQYTVGGQRVRGVTLVKGGRYQVCFRGKYIGLCTTLLEAALKWNEAARAAGVAESELNALPADAAADAGAPRDPALKRKHAKYSMSDDGTAVSLFPGHSMTRQAFLATAEALCKRARNHSVCTWGALAHQLGMGDLIGKSAAVHACWAALTGSDMKKTMWELYHSGGGEARSAGVANAAASGTELLQPLCRSGGGEVMSAATAAAAPAGAEPMQVEEKNEAA